jgi:hypothetical protein
MNSMYALWLRTTHFPETFKSPQKPRCQKTDLEEVHNVNFRHCLCCSALDMKISGACLPPHPQLHVTGIDGDIWKAHLYIFWRLYKLKSRLSLLKNRHDTLSVSKSAIWYEKYVHIIACLARSYISRAWVPVKMTSISLPRNANYAQAKGYHPISLLSFMQKTVQKFVARNIRDESLAHVPNIYTNLPTNWGSKQTPQCTMWLDIHTKLHFSFHRYWGSIW